MSFGSRTRVSGEEAKQSSQWIDCPTNAAKVKARSTRVGPCGFVRRRPAMVFIQPNASSIRLRTPWLAA